MTPQAQPGDRPVTPPPPVLPRFDPNLSNRAQRVLWSLTEWAWGHKAYCYPTVATIADKVGYGRRNVSHALKELETKGYIATHYNRSDKGRYRVIVIVDRVPAPKLHMVDPPTDPRLETTDKSQRDRAPQGGGRALPSATPAHSSARPIAHSSAPKDLPLNPQRESKKNSEAAAGQKAGGPPPRSGNEQTQADDPQPWLNVDNLTPADVANWQAIADQPRNPMRRIATRILERYEQRYPGMQADMSEVGTSGPASRQEPPGQTSRDKSEDSIQANSSGSDKRSQLE